MLADQVRAVLASGASYWKAGSPAPPRERLISVKNELSASLTCEVAAVAATGAADAVPALANTVAMSRVARAAAARRRTRGVADGCIRTRIGRSDAGA